MLPAISTECCEDHQGGCYVCNDICLHDCSTCHRRLGRQSCFFKGTRATHVVENITGVITGSFPASSFAFHISPANSFAFHISATEDGAGRHEEAAICSGAGRHEKATISYTMSLFSFHHRKGRSGWLCVLIFFFPPRKRQIESSVQTIKHDVYREQKDIAHTRSCVVQIKSIVHIIRHDVIRNKKTLSMRIQLRKIHWFQHCAHV